MFVEEYLVERYFAEGHVCRRILDRKIFRRKIFGEKVLFDNVPLNKIFFGEMTVDEKSLCTRQIVCLMNNHLTNDYSLKTVYGECDE
jgi:hypothetical protein